MLSSVAFIVSVGGHCIRVLTLRCGHSCRFNDHREVACGSFSRLRLLPCWSDGLPQAICVHVGGRTRRVRCRTEATYTNEGTSRALPNQEMLFVRSRPLYNREIAFCRRSAHWQLARASADQARGNVVVLRNALRRVLFEDLVLYG